MRERARRFSPKPAGLWRAAGKGEEPMVKWKRQAALLCLAACLACGGAFAPPRLLPAFPDLFPAFGEMRIRAAGTAYGGTARVLYRQNTASVIDNGVSPLLAAIAGFIVAFLIAGLIFCAADYPAYRREKLARQQTEEGEPPKK